MSREEADALNGFTVWFTGLPSSGKSTLAGLLASALRARALPVEVLDGDEVRAVLTRGLGFSRVDRDENIRRIAWVAKVLTRNGVVAISAAISPYREARGRAREEIGRFVEVYVDCPIEVCMTRDVKGLYARALRGEIADFTGVSDPYEPPDHPEITVQTHRETAPESLEKILGHLRARGWIEDGMTPVRLPTYMVERLHSLWGDGLETRLLDLLARELAATAEPIHPEEKEQILDRLRSLGYLD